MSSAKLTMIGLYNFDPTLFDDISLPSGINKDILIPEILRQCGEFEILYPNLDFLKFMISNWSEKHYRTFEKWVEGLSEEFNPLHNYDRHEVYTDTHKSKDDESSSSHSTTSTSSGGSVNRNVAAYDASSLQPKEGETSTGTGSGSGDSSGSINRTGEVSITHEAHLFGNIGVTQSTEMLMSFLEAERWNIYEHIAELFVDEFCIRIY